MSRYVEVWGRMQCSQVLMWKLEMQISKEKDKPGPGPPWNHDR